MYVDKLQMGHVTPQALLGPPNHVFMALTRWASLPMFCPAQIPDQKALKKHPKVTKVSPRCPGHEFLASPDIKFLTM